MKYFHFYLAFVFVISFALVDFWGSVLIPIFGSREVCGYSLYLLSCSFEGWRGQAIVELCRAFLLIGVALLVFGFCRSRQGSKE